ncbi:MAG: hypothetical protein ACHQ15_06420 [Candidatus Limnocylindrales bacterium]
MVEESPGEGPAPEATGDPYLEPSAPFPETGGQVSGHRPASVSSRSITESPEHDWAAARSLVFPILRPPGTVGADPEVKLDVLRSQRAQHILPLASPGPAGLVVSFALQGPGFQVLVNGEHLLSWGLEADELATAAGMNLAAWSAGAGWTDEISGRRRILSSDTGAGHDAARILLSEVREHLARELTAEAEPGTRILVGVPERHLLLAGTLAPDDEEFAVLFHEFVAEHAEDADEPIDRRVLELRDGDLVWYAG